MTEGLKDRPLGDLAEGDPAPIRLGDLKRFGNVPGDRLPFSVKVGGEPDRLRPLRRAANVGEAPLLLLNDLVVRGEAVLHIYRQAAEPLRRLRCGGIALLPSRTLRRHAPLCRAARLLGEIANVPIRGKHRVVRAEVALNRGRLGRRLHDDQVLRHSLTHARERSTAPSQTLQRPPRCSARPCSASRVSALGSAPSTPSLTPSRSPSVSPAAPARPRA